MLPFLFGIPFGNFLIGFLSRMVHHECLNFFQNYRFNELKRMFMRCIIILENAKMVEFRKMIIIVLDTKLAHLSTHFFEFQVLAEFGDFCHFGRFLKEFWDFSKGNKSFKIWYAQK